MTERTGVSRHSAPRASTGIVIRAAAPLGAVLAALPALEVSAGPWIGAGLAAALVLGFHYRPLSAVGFGLMIGGAANWLVATLSTTLTPSAADSMLTGLLLLGLGLGLVAGLRPTLIGAVLLGPWILVGNAMRAPFSWLHTRRRGGTT